MSTCAPCQQPADNAGGGPPPEYSGRDPSNWRIRGEGPAFIKLRRKAVRYDPATLDRFVAENQAQRPQSNPLQTKKAHAAEPR